MLRLKKLWDDSGDDAYCMWAGRIGDRLDALTHTASGTKDVARLNRTS